MWNTLRVHRFLSGWACSVGLWSSGWVVCCSAAFSAEDRIFQAGAATVNITPPLGELIVGGWKPLPADEVHDELHASCIVLDDGVDRLAIVVCDNVGIPREVYDRSKQRIEAVTGIPVENQLMAATHTHSATTARGSGRLVPDQELTEYQTFLSNRIIDAVRLAVKRLEPAEIGWGAVDEPSQLFNRRWFVVEEAERRNPFGGVDQVRMNPGKATLIRPAGPIDPEVSILAVRNKQGQAMAVLANYSLHYVGGVPAREISADYFGVFADYLTKRLSSAATERSCVCILSNGTSGDVNNIDFREPSSAREPYQKMREVGELIGRRVYDQLQGLEFQSWVDLQAAASELPLQVRKPSAELMAYMEEVARKADGDEVYHPHEKIYAERLQILAQSPDLVEVPLQVLKLGELGIAAVPFEVFTETGLEIKERCPLPNAFTMELANGSYGYLPTPAQHELGGYETWMGTNKVELNAATKIVERLMQMWDAME